MLRAVSATNPNNGRPWPRRLSLQLPFDRLRLGQQRKREAGFVHNGSMLLPLSVLAETRYSLRVVPRAPPSRRRTLCQVNDRGGFPLTYDLLRDNCS
jgi:hypothetical protein